MAEGMENTKEALKQVGILTLGQGENKLARKPVYGAIWCNYSFLRFSVFLPRVFILMTEWIYHN